MFSSSPNYTKLKTHLRLAINRLKLIEKKKTELTQKARKEIADYIQIGKYERAKIRVEHIIREDYLVEAMEIVEMYCDLILARFGLVTQMKALDEGIAEAISSIIWVAPRLQSDIQELKIISDILVSKYGKPYSEACRNESVKTISEKLKHKLSVQSPPKILVEKYMIEIAKNYNLHYEPDPNVMKEESGGMMDAFLIDLSDKNNLDGGIPQPPGFIGFPQLPNLPDVNHHIFHQPGPDGGFVSSPGPSAPFSYNIPPNESKEQNLPLDVASPDDNLLDDDKPQPLSSKLSDENGSGLTGSGSSSSLPSVPSDLIYPQGNDIDFDDLTRRFEELKKKK